MQDTTPPPDRHDDPDLDADAAHLLHALQSGGRLHRHLLLCRLVYGGAYRKLGCCRLRAIVAALARTGPQYPLLVDTLNLLAEIDAISTLGVAQAAASTDVRWHSPTASLFGHPVAVLWHAVTTCVRQHWVGGADGRSLQGCC